MLHKLAVLLLFLSLYSILHADKTFCHTGMYEPFVTIHLSTDNCFYPQYAEQRSSSSYGLKKYLDKFPQNTITYPYYYWYYLRKADFLSALMVLEEIANSAKSKYLVSQYNGDFEFVMLNGVRQLYDAKSGIIAKSLHSITLKEASVKFFNILNQIISLFSEASDKPRPDSWILWKTYSLLFSNISAGINWEGDEFIHKQWNKRIKLWKSRSLKGYLAFFIYFISGEKSLLPSKTTFFAKLEKHIVIRKFQDNNKEIKTLKRLSQIMARFTLENLATIPQILFVEPEILKEKIKNNLANNTDLIETCRHLKNRREMLTHFKEKLSETVDYNDALTIMEGCELDFSMPFIIENNSIIISFADAYVVDIALAKYHIKKHNYSYEKAGSIIGAAVLASLSKYLEGNYNTDFGRTISYAYFTDRIDEFRDSRLLYKIYSARNKLSNEKIMKSAEFVSQFYRNHE